MNQVQSSPVNQGVNGAVIMMEQSSITEASIEVIDTLPAIHRLAIKSQYKEDFRYKVKIDAAVCYLSVRVALAKSLEGNTRDYVAIALTPPPWFADDFDVNLIAKSIINELSGDYDEAGTPAGKVNFDQRIEALSEVFGVEVQL
ncbi:hypothetical protein [Methylotenera sp.]|uniref:hypothetical protein n=1 Tax=Methylotenera sp. TaxID=2051956 RepID=UPI0025FBF759|nr:hypothetical protein [Methylotenera sp.]